MSKEEIERLVEEAERYKAEDEAQRARIEAKNSLENYLFQTKNAVNDEKLAEKITEDEKKQVLDVVQETTKWIDSNQGAEKEVFEEKQKEVEKAISPITLKMYQSGPPPEGAPDGATQTAAPDASTTFEPKIEEID